VKEPPPKKIEFETKIDTVTADHGNEHAAAGSQTRGVQIRYMVQIGAFKDPKNATAIQAASRQRYHLPVLNDYFAGLGLYQIRIGFFESREAARAFRQKMIQEYPADYKDSWVVQLKR
jgi:cell division septation protein DedD